MTKGSQRSGYRESCMVSSNPYKLIRAGEESYSSHSSSLRGITDQSKGVKEFENDEADHTNGGKVYTSDNGHDRAHLSLVDHDEIIGMPTSTELNKGSVQPEREIELEVDAVAEGMDTRETVSVNDQRVAKLSTDAGAELELTIKDSSGGNPTVKQISKGRAVTASDARLYKLNSINNSSLVLSSTMKKKPINSSVLCNDYDSI
ncbi:unnamed protein product, partial [Trichobilharzia regenti]